MCQTCAGLKYRKRLFYLTVKKMSKRLLLVLVFSVFLLSGFVNAYIDTSTSMTFQLSPDKVHVIEKTVVLLENAAEKSAFSSSLTLGKSTISDWRAYSDNIDYHVYGPLVYVNSTRIVAKLDTSIPQNPAVIVVEYDVSPAILSKTVKSTRVVEYSLNFSLLNVKRLQSKEIVLGNIGEFSFEIPDGDAFSLVRPDAIKTGSNSVSFKGPITSSFEIAFIEEKTLSQEVNDFFVQTYSNVANLIPLLLVLALLVFVWFKLVSGD